MSRYTSDPTVHDFFVGMAIRTVRNWDKSSELVGADGLTPFRDCVSRGVKAVLGYKPDAILEGSKMLWLVEVKSYENLFSPHSQRQFEVIGRALSEFEDVMMFCLIFGCEDVDKVDAFFESQFPGFENVAWAMTPADWAKREAN